MSSIVVCPKCQCQLEVKVAFASGPKSAPDSNGNGGAPADLAALLDRINDDELTGKNREFVTQTRERFEQYGKRTRMSDKQMAWLRKIADGDTGDEW